MAGGGRLALVAALLCAAAAMAAAQQASGVRATYNSLLQIGPFVPVPKSYLSRFWNRDKAAGTKALEAFVPGGRTGTKCPSC